MKEYMQNEWEKNWLTLYFEKKRIKTIYIYPFYLFYKFEGPVPWSNFIHIFFYPFLLYTAKNFLQ